MSPIIDGTPYAVKVARAVWSCTKSGRIVRDEEIINAGFETGDLTGWTILSEEDSVSVSSGDSYETPKWGTYMAVLGTPGQGVQPIGNNTLQQTFEARSDILKFSYSLHSEEPIASYDSFSYELKIFIDQTRIYYLHLSAGSASGEWVDVELDISDYQGQELEFTVSAGGTDDTSFRTWVYIDAPE